MFFLTSIFLAFCLVLADEQDTFTLVGPKSNTASSKYLYLITFIFSSGHLRVASTTSETTMIPHPHTSCSSGKAAITITRVTKAWSNEESFKIYQGTSYSSGTLKYTQPSVSNNRSYTWTLCLSSGSHVLRLLDSYGDGWTSGSYVALTLGSSVLGPYTLTSGSSGSLPFTVVISGSGGGSGGGSSSGPTSCSSGYALLTFNRVTKSWSSEESFKLYQGTSYTSGTLKYTQPSVSDNQSYTWRVCVPGGSYVLRLLDSYGDGWTTGSTVSLSVGSSTLGPYYLGSGSSGTTSFTISSGSSGGGSGGGSSVNLSNVQYPQTSFTILKGVIFSIGISNDSSSINYSVYSGSLPSGLSLNTSTGTISGTPTSTVTGRSVTIKVYSSSSNYVTRSLSFTVFQNPSSCSSDKVLVTINRTTKQYAYEESFKIYQGTSTSGTLKYTQPFVNNDFSYAYAVCLSGGSHYLQLLDSYGDGWSSGSSISLTIGSASIGPYTLSSGSSGSDTFTVVTGASNPTSCSSSQVLVTISRTTKGDANEEGFKIYQGSNTSGTLKYSQPAVANYQSYTWTVCLNTGSHVLQLLDSYGDGWSSGSNIQLTFGSTTIGPYVLSSGSSGTQLFTVTSGSTVDLTGVQYPVSSFTIQKGVSFSISPTGDATSINYSVYTGSLPSGLSLNTSTGMISGTPSSTVTGRSVTIKVYSSSSNYVYRELTFSVFENPSSCTGNKVLVTISRVTTSYAYEESFKIYEGTGTTGAVLFTQPYISNSNTYTWKVCLSPTNYILQLLDSYGDGWSSNSIVSLSYAGGSTVGPHTLSSGSEATQSFVISGSTSSELQDIVYPVTTFRILKDVPFSINLLNDASDVNYSIHEGTLPAGLTLNPSTGTISGIPTSVVNSRNVIIKVYKSSTLYVTRCLTFTVFENPSSCPAGQVLVTIYRITEDSASEETFKIYEGSETGTLKFTQPYVNNDSSYTWKVCLNPGSHTVEFLDSYGDGWDENSSISFTFASTNLGPYRLEIGNTATRAFAVTADSSSNPSSCPRGQVLVTLTRTTKLYSNEESFKIYQGTSTSGPLMFTQPALNDNSAYTWTVCLMAADHILQLLDSFDDGWRDGSSLTVKIGSTSMGPYHLDSGSMATVAFSTASASSSMSNTTLIFIGVVLLIIVVNVNVFVVYVICSKKKKLTVQSGNSVQESLPKPVLMPHQVNMAVRKPIPIAQPVRI